MYFLPYAVVAVQGLSGAAWQGKDAVGLRQNGVGAARPHAILVHFGRVHGAEKVIDNRLDIGVQGPFFSCRLTEAVQMTAVDPSIVNGFECLSRAGDVVSLPGVRCREEEGRHVPHRSFVSS